MSTTREAAAVIASAVALIAVVASPTVASASVVSASCTGGGHNLNASSTYSTRGAYHVWSMSQWNINGAPTGHKNNINIRLMANGNQKWAWNSPDSISSGDGHVGMGSFATLARDSEQITFQAIFDVRGYDPRCTAVSKKF
ncbi:MAG: hypothetical protein E6777_02825 [Propionibacterium sp.]|jgi:hypothetical protein|nr:hypothetical protein [Propionibacterium sp.]